MSDYKKNKMLEGAISEFLKASKGSELEALIFDQIMDLIKDDVVVLAA